MKTVFTFPVTAILCALLMNNAVAQTNTFPTTGSAGIGTITPDASSLLEIKSTSKGLLIPRMKKTQRDAIVAPALGLLIYQNTDTTGFYYYSGTAWRALSIASANTSLSNLTTTSINKNLIPDTAGKRNIGTLIKPWLNGYFSGKLAVGTTDTTARLNIGGNIKIVDGTQGAGKVLTSNNTGLASWTTPAVSPWTVSGNNIYNSNTGNVGIGTSSPAARLHVKGNTDVSQLIIDANSTQSNTNPLIKLRSTDGTDLMWIHSDNATNTFVGLNAGRVNVPGGGLYNTFNGSKAGYSNTTGNYNTANGYQALYSNTYGSGNAANGYQALYSNTTGGGNSANGYQALFSSITGNYNTANGLSALFSNKAGNNGVAIGNFSQSNVNNTATSWDNTNTSIGYQSLMGSVNPANNTGAANTAIGRDALFSNSTGNSNTANGDSALFSNTTGSYNTATGMQALTANTIGNYNTANGQGALYSNTTGSNNTATGLGALFFNTTGNDNTANGVYALYNLYSGSNNTANGVDALNNLYSGSSNTAIGWGALYKKEEGDNNTANGVNALHDNFYGDFNTAIGGYAIYLNEDGNRNTAIGYYSGYNGYDGSNNVTIGYNAQVPDGNASNQVRIGDENITYAGVQVAWTITSDRRWKSDIQEANLGLNFIAKLKPVSYFRNNDKSKKREYGFIAQDLEEALNTSGAGNNGMISKDDKGMYGVRYNDLIAPMVKGMQELSKQNDLLQKQNDFQQKQIDAQQQQINDLKSLVLSIQQCSPCNTAGTTAQTYNTTITDGAALEQNVPNPFSHSTTIGYTLPQKYTTAQIMITDKSGKTLKLVNVSGSGKGNVNVDASVLASGAYNYSLLVDGKLVGTKQMVLTK